MIITKTEFLLRAHLDQQTLEVWIQEEWLTPEQADTEPQFSEADLARAGLILLLLAYTYCVSWLVYAQ